MNCQKSRKLAYKIRLHALEMTSRGGTSHIASIFSMADLVAVLYADQVKADKDLSVEEARAKYASEYVENVAGCLNAAKQGMVDDVIEPAQTRAMLISALEMLMSKRDSNPPKKHGNLPM